LLGRDSTGSPTEPSEYYASGSDYPVEFEREFRKYLALWSISDLQIECDDCHTESEEKTHELGDYWNQNKRDLCATCYNHRMKQPSSAESEASGS
jgi:hypothetical protein